MTSALSRTIFAVLALALSFGGYAADKKVDTGKASKADRDFIMKAAQDNLMEIELAKVVQEKSTRAEVKDYAQRLSDDHSKAQQELEGIASKLGVTVPKQLDKKHAKELKEMSKKSAKRFDHEYAELMVEDHKKAVKLFEKESKKADAEELRQFASKTLPVLQDHLAKGRDLEKLTK
jgi:putative membrane protein